MWAERGYVVKSGCTGVARATGASMILILVLPKTVVLMMP